MILPIGYWVAQLIGWKVNEKAENMSTEKTLVSKFVEASLLVSTVQSE